MAWISWQVVPDFSKKTKNCKFRLTYPFFAWTTIVCLCYSQISFLEETSKSRRRRRVLCTIKFIYFKDTFYLSVLPHCQFWHATFKCLTNQAGGWHQWVYHQSKNSWKGNWGLRIFHRFNFSPIWLLSYSFREGGG